MLSYTKYSKKPEMSNDTILIKLEGRENKITSENILLI